MRQTLRYFTIFFLISNLLIANVGVSMHWLYCACKGQLQTSIFQIKSHCEAENEQDCCKKELAVAKELKPCCQKFKQLLGSEKKHDCTKKGTKLIKADLKFVPSSENTFKSFDVAFSNTSFSQVFENQNFTFQSAANAAPSNKAPPPRPYNRALLSLIQSFLC